MPILSRAAETETDSIDVGQLFCAFTTDFASSFVFGISEGYNLTEDLDSRRLWFNILLLSLPSNRLCEFKWITETLSKLGIPLVPPGYFEAKRYSEAWAIEKVKRAENRLRESNRTGKLFLPGDFPILFSAVRDGIAQDAGVEKTFIPNHEQQQELASECNDHISKEQMTDPLSHAENFANTLVQALEETPQVQMNEEWKLGY